MNWSTALLLGLAAVGIITLALGLIFDPGSILKVAAMPFIFLRGVVARINAFVESALGKCQSLWKSHTARLETQSNDSDSSKSSDPDSNATLWFVARLLYLAIAVVMIMATGLLDIERANAAQFNNRGGDLNLPGFLANDTLLNGVIWITLIMFWGIFSLDIFEMISPHARLLRVTNKYIKGFLRAVAIVGVMLLVGAVTLLYYSASLATHNAHWTDAADYLAGAQGALVNVAGFLALLALISGLVVLVLVGDGILVVLLSLAHIVTSELETLCRAGAETVVRILGIQANALRSGWNILARMRIMQDMGAPIFQRIVFHDNGVIDTGSYSAPSSPAARSVYSAYSAHPVDVQTLSDPVFHAQSADQDTYLTPLEPVRVGKTVLLAVGRDSVEVLGQILQDVHALDGSSLISAVGTIPLVTPGEVLPPLNIPISGIRNLSPGEERISQAYARKLTEDEVRMLLVDDLIKNAENYCLSGGVSRGQILLLLNLDSVAVTRHAIERLGQLNEYEIGVVAISPRYRSPTLDINAALNELIQWRAQRYIAGTLLLDHQSSLAGKEGDGRQQQLLGKAIASMICAPSSDPDNGAMSTVLRHLGEVAPFIACGIASEAVASGAQKAAWWWLNAAFSAPRRGSGDAISIRRQTYKLFTKLLEERNQWTIGLSSGLPRDARKVTLITAPMRAADPRWKDFQEQLTAMLTAIAPHTLPLYINGNGVPDSPWLTRQYYTQVAVLAGFDNVYVDKHGALNGTPAPYLDRN